MTAHSQRPSSWNEKTLSLLVPLPDEYEGSGIVCSLASDSDIELSQRELSLLRLFSGGAHIGAIKSDLLAFATDDLDGSDADREMQAFFQVQRFEILGILGELITLEATQVGALRIASGQDRRARALTVAEVCAAATGRDVEPQGFADPYSADRNHGLPDVCVRPDGQLVLIDPAEMAQRAYLAQGALQAILRRPEDFLQSLTAVPTEFFGSQRGGIPYQSIFVNGSEVVRGRRPDVYERMQSVDEGDLRGKTVLDLGCNIGMNCFLAIDRGAVRAVGIDRAPLTQSATRLNGFFDMPCQFEPHDLNAEVDGLGPVDTVFVFALIGHLQSVDGLLTTIKTAGASTVYVETHCDIQQQGDVDHFLAAPMFAETTFRGYERDNIHRSSRTRRLYRCQVRHGG